MTGLIHTLATNTGTVVRPDIERIIQFATGCHRQRLRKVKVTTFQPSEYRLVSVRMSGLIHNVEIDITDDSDDLTIVPEYKGNFFKKHPFT